MNVIATEQLSLNYGNRTGITEVDLCVPQGEIFGFLGPNGAGKTTTIRILLGLLKPHQGTARIFGQDCWSHSATIKESLGYLPGDLRLYPWFTGKRALSILSSIRGKDLSIRGQQLLDRFQLDENVPARKMSRGMRQKLGIILALVHEPQLLILDEPTSGLDPLMCDELYRCLRELTATGATVFFSSHTLSEVELLCNRVAIVRGGRIIADESMDTLRKRVHRAVVLRYREPDDAARTQLPSFLQLEECNGAVCRCVLTGTTPQLVEWAAEQPLEDLSVSPPSLESLFRRFYEAKEPGK
ncbi:ABC transporter ATP-binding protein [Bythopirellula polymerisocia]|uniref:Daunorubicin/doxorubicin resistance ATP-binding protein DrrA n=1 Tax=Bythopirellula polymerisocia TaxID=2528003 RepID=A0A5C6CMP0_9BACT|nr:ABC transporter ATP-binding protein [Bythopirellula polymerisocia]TWU25678.1 Daunorubicin/doxorubicin resistance ATP-binding protein DrrA [Bythopirellula polymerisocia]